MNNKKNFNTAIMGIDLLIKSIIECIKTRWCVFVKGYVPFLFKNGYTIYHKCASPFKEMENNIRKTKSDRFSFLVE